VISEPKKIAILECTKSTVASSSKHHSRPTLKGLSNTLRAQKNFLRTRNEDNRRIRERNKVNKANLALGLVEKK
jgi:hypothetical protein